MFLVSFGFCKRHMKSSMISSTGNQNNVFPSVLWFSVFSWNVFTMAYHIDQVGTITLVVIFLRWNGSSESIC